MKGKCFQFINSVLLYYKKGIYNESVINLCYTIVEPAIKNLTYIKEQKFNYLVNMEKDGDVSDNNYEFLMYEILLFFERFITNKPVVDIFSGYIKQ